MNYAEICIIKRDGKREDFSISKIKNAISKAFSATGIRDERRQILHRLAINQIRRRLVLLRFVHIRVSGTIDHHTDFPLRHATPHGLQIGDVQLRHIREDITATGIPPRQLPHLIAQLPVSAGHQYIRHIDSLYNRTKIPPPSDKDGACPSRKG